MSKAASLRINPVWTNYAQGLANTRYISNSIFPAITVDESETHGKIPLISDENFELSESRRAPHGDTPKINGKPLKPPIEYGCEFDVLAYGIDFTERKGKVIDMYRHAAWVVTEKIRLRRELAIAQLVRNASLYTDSNTASPSVKWNTANGDPLADIAAAVSKILDNTGQDDDLHYVFGPQAWTSFKGSAKVRAALSDTQARVVTLDKAKELLETQNIHIGKAWYKDPITGVRTNIWADDVIVYCDHPPADVRTIYSHAFGFNVRVRGFDKDGPAMDQYKSEDGLVEYMRGYTWEDLVFHGSRLGYLIDGVN